MSMRTSASRRWLVLVGAVATVLALLVVAPVGGPTRAVAAAPADPCVSTGDGTPLPASCQVSLEPTSLPQHTVIGEYETGLLTQQDGRPRSAVGDLAAGGLPGSCDPATEDCSLTDTIDFSDPRNQAPGSSPVSVPADSFGPSDRSTDAATVAVDVNGDGRQEIVRASTCAATKDLCLSTFQPGEAAQGRDAYSASYSTGLSVDTTGVGRIRLAAGPVALASTTVTGATFAVDASQKTTVATFTTAGRHGFKVGDPVRLGNDPGLQATLCVASPLSKEGTQCIGQDLVSYHPISAVTTTTFSVDLGVLVVSRQGVGQVVTPRSWSAGCATCGVRAESLSTAIVVAWTAPTMSLKVATFSLTLGAQQPLRLLDVREVGRLFQDGTDTAPAREAVSLVVDDFEVGGPDEIAVAWGGSCGGQALPCPKLAFLAMDDAKRLNLRSAAVWGGDPWCNNTGTPVATPASWGPLSISMTSGHFRHQGGAGGADLALAWVAAADPAAGQTGAVYHVFQSFDVTPQLTLDPTRPLSQVDPASGTADPLPCATVTATRASGTDLSAVRSQVQIAAGNVDGRPGDELAVAETLPTLPASEIPGGAPVSVSVWSQGVDGQDGPGWRPQTRRQPAVDAVWKQPYAAPAAATTTVSATQGYQAVGGGGSGQISLAVGRLARRPGGSAADVPYPNAVNPDVIVGWTCQGATSCGTTTISGPVDVARDAVALDALGVVVDQAGLASFAHEGSSTTSARGADVPAAVSAQAPYSAAQNRTFVQVAAADVNGDSSTLGDPVRSFSVGEVQPLMILRAPPVEFAPIDGSHPGYGKDGWISSAEVYDESSCYAANGANTDSGECPMRTTYETSGGTDTSLAVSVGNSWGLDASTKVGGGDGTHAINGECFTAVCWELSVEVGYSHKEEQQSEQQRAKSFRYASQQVIAPMQDRAFVATSDIETDQVPVYYGTFSGGALPTEPDLWTYSATPLDTVFSWIATNDPQYGSTFAGVTPGNVLSYPASGSQVPTRTQSVLSVHREGASTLVVTTSSNHGYLCALDKGQVQTSFPSSIGAECAGQSEPVRLRGAGAFDGTDYTVSAIRSPTQVVLQRTGSQVPISSDPCAGGGCTLSREPSQLPVQTQEIGPGTEGHVSFTFGQVEGFEQRYAVSNGGSAEVSADVSTKEDAFTWEAHVKGEFEHNDESMMNMTLESETAWSFDYGSASRPGTYRVTPYLADDPRTGALTLTWTAAPVGSSGLWGNPLYGYGAVGDPDLPARPDAAFSLPKLYEPYRVHTGLDDNLDVLLASPDFVSWECDAAKVCRPRDAIEVGRPMQISTVVHNYALADLNASPSKPLLVRFYVGDPARGGYAIAESKVTQTIPFRGQTAVQASWTPPSGFAGQPGQPIYAVIDPDNAFPEVFDWKSPVVLWNRNLNGHVVSASSHGPSGARTWVFTTDVDHGLSLGDPVTTRHLGGYRVTDAKVVDSTPTSFTVAADARLSPLTRAGTWASTQDSSCMTNNPWYGSLTKDYYSFGGLKEFQSPCPTTDNEGYFLTPRVKGNRAAVQRSNLSVGPGSVRVSRDGRSVLVDVRSSAALYGADLATRVWVCATPRTTCSPQLASLAARYEARSTVTVGPRGTTRVRVPLGGTRLAAGSYRIGVQVVPLSVWERPPGPGLYAAAMGQRADDQAVARVLVP